jgi:hypothetical protein
MSDGQFVGSNGEIAALSSTTQSGCRPATTRVLSVDPSSGTTSQITSVNFAVSQAFFEPGGTLVALEKSKVYCEAVLTTTSTTTTMPALRIVQSTGTSGGGSFVVGPGRYVLEALQGGTWTQVVAGVTAATLVP